MIFLECESCGSKMEKEGSYLVNIEGARLQVCFRCQRLGKILSGPRHSPQKGLPGFSQSHAHSAPRPSLRMEYELVENYGQIIKSAREKIGLPLKVVAEKIAETESFLDRIEKQKTRPPIPVAKKLEKELGISLLEETSDSQEGPDLKPHKKFSGAITLGDIIEIEKKKKK
ncbi:MAG: multiprotein bridging factor aMBF1 [Candidatus Micrarchaeota archaeon]